MCWVKIEYLSSYKGVLLFGYTALLGNIGVLFSKLLEKAFILPVAQIFVCNETFFILICPVADWLVSADAFLSSDI